MGQLVYKRLLLVCVVTSLFVTFFVLHSTVLVSNSDDALRPNASLRPSVDSSLADILKHDGGGKTKANKGIVQRLDAIFSINEDDLLSHELDKRRVPPGRDHVTFRNDAEMRVVHLDLKGAPPKLSYLRTLLPLLASAGANALLLEYEDMFPYSGHLANISARNAYTKEQISAMLQWAAENGLQVIPLVQTFGHLEFALKLPEFRHLRELAPFPQELCPTNPDSFSVLVSEMIRQVMALHPAARWLHVGCDEVFHIGACGRCSRRRVDSRMIFTEHVSMVARYVRQEYPGVTPLVWDDMMRQWTPLEVMESGLGALVEPVVWVYIEDILRLVPPYVWYMYGRTFPHVWAASAYKGAYGVTALTPDLKRHYENHESWLRLIHRNESGLSVNRFRGIVLTGWSRYDHFAVLCELLPTAVPSLVLNLVLLSGHGTGRPEVIRAWLDQLACPESFKGLVTLEALSRDPYQWRLGECSFPGANMYSATAELKSLQLRVDNLHTELTQRQGWMTSYNVRHAYSSPWRVVQLYTAPGSRLLRELNTFRNHTAVMMSQYYDRYSVSEWLEQRLGPLAEKMRNLEEGARVLLGRDTWPRRPTV